MSRVKKELVVLTGPPGAGKLQYARDNYPDATVYESSLGNKPLWRDQPGGSAVLITSAPASAAKEYWVDEAKRFGFTPTVVVLSGDKVNEVRMLLSRETTDLNERQRARVAKRVSRWYTSYEYYKDEISVYAGDKSIPKTKKRRTPAPRRLRVPASS